MSRKDYQNLAAAFREAFEDAECAEIEEGINRALDFVIEALAEDNPRFDAARFREAVTGRTEAVA